VTMTGSLTLTNGLFRVSEPTSSVQYTSSTTMTIPSTAGLELNGGNLLSGNYSITNNGLFRMTAYAADDTLGNTSGNSITNTGASAFMDIEGGKLTVASQIIVKNGANFTYNDLNSSNYQNNGGQQDTIILNNLGTTNNTQALLDVDATSKIYITDGYIIFHNPNSGTGYDARFTSGSGTKFIDPNNSSTLQFGNAGTSSTSAIFKMVDTAGLAFNNIAINPTGGHDTLYFYSPISLNGNGIFSLNSGIVKLNNNVLTITNTSDSAISRTTGFMISEDTNNFGAITRYIPAFNGNQFIFPFGNKYGVYIPLLFKNFGASADTVQVSTFAPSDSLRHKPYPLTVIQIRDSAIPTHTSDSAYMVNRYWQINANNVSSSNYATVVFNYAYTERPALGESSGMKAQRWVSATNGWLSPYLVYNAGGSQSSTQSNSTTAGTVTVAKLNHCSPWTLTSSGNPLPIELLNFTANYNGINVDLNWTTSSEINNDYFTVLRTVDIENFDFIAAVGGAGNSNVMNYYRATDFKPVSGLSYYQLKQTDYNGQSTFSDLVPIEIGKAVFEIRNLYSNHDENAIHVIISDNENESVTVALHDLLGNMILQKKVNITSSATDIKLDVNIPLGLYFITLRNDTKFLTGKVVY